MSLDVSPALLDRAENGKVNDTDLAECVRTSLPYVWQVVSVTADALERTEAPYADHSMPPPSEQHRGQLLRAMASDAIRSSLERHFGIALGFQNCHHVAAFRLTDEGDVARADFISPRSQLLNQSPELRDC